MKDKLKNFFKTQIYKNIYNIKPNKNIWIFSSTNNEKYNYNSKYLFEYILKNEKDIKPYFVINDDKLRNKLQEKYGENLFIETKSKNGIKKVLTGGVWLTSAGLPLYGFNLKRNRIIINLWHGVPLKKIALMENNFGKLKKCYFKKIFSKNYSYILTTSKKLIPIMKESFGVDEKIIKVWGQSRNDCLFKKTEDNKINKLISNLPSYDKLILYAPTYRDNSQTKLFPFDDYNKNELENFLEEKKSIIFIRTHLDEGMKNINKYLGKRVILLNENILEDIMVVLNQFHILITDYSSIYIDFLLLQRPLIFLPYDKEEYINSRGLNFYYDKFTPGYKPNTMKELIEYINQIFNENDKFEKDRKIINEYFNEIDYPCSKKICENIKNLYLHQIE